MEEMVLTTGACIDIKAIRNIIKKMTNHVYKLLPMREEGGQWRKLLETLVIQLSGMKRLIEGQDELIFSLLCKMEGLLSLSDDERDDTSYRRVIFDCLGLLNTLEKDVCD